MNNAVSPVFDSFSTTHPRARGSLLTCSLTVLDLESNNVAELDQIEQLGTCQMLRDLTLDGNPISKRKAYRRIVGSLIPQLETLDYTDVSTKERRLLDDDVLAKLRRKCKDSADGGSSKSRSRSNTPKHHHPRVGVGGFSNGDSAPGSPFAGGGGLDGTDGSRNGTPAGTPSAGSRSRRGSSRRGLSNAGGGGDSAISELQMVAEAIKWGNTNGIARAQSATGSPRPRRELPRRPYSSSDHVELSSQLSQYKWHREQSGHAAHMLQLLEEIGVEEGSEVSSSSGLTMGSSVTFAGNPIMAMRARRMSVGDGAGDELANVLDEGRSALGLSPRPGLVDALSPMSAAGSGARSPAPEPTVEDVKHDLRTWNLDAAVAKLRIRAGRPASRPGTARSQSGGPASPAVGAARFGRPPVSVDSERSSGLGDSFSESRSPARFNHRHGSGGGSGTGGGMQAEVMLLGDDRHARANDLSADSHRLMNSSRGSDAGTGDLLATTSRPLPEKGIRRVGSNGSSDSGGDDAEPSLAAGSKKATSPGPASLFHARKPSIGWGEDGGDSSLERAGGSRPQQSKSKRASHSLPRHDDGEDVESSDGEGEIEEDGDDEGARTYRHLPDSELVAMLKKKPKKVPELQVWHCVKCSELLFLLLFLLLFWFWFWFWSWFWFWFWF